jgi:hypothetical protein
MEEVWGKIKGFENYEVSNFGRVKRNKSTILYKNGVIANHKEKILTQEVVKKYKRVTLSENNIQKRFLVHRLVALYFIKNINNKPCVNHKDGDKLNNNLSNLEWCTYSENEKHSYLVLGKINPIRKLTTENILFIRGNYLFGRNGNIKNLSTLFNVSIRTIYNVVKYNYYV